DRYIDFRVSTFPTPLGEKAAVRVLDPTTGVKSIDGLGLEGRNAELVREGLARPFGTILLTGPTGSGKTTTLYALLQELNKVDVNIVSLEDPVEYFVAGVNQSQVQPEIGYDFASGLRQILRQDPDVILVGEIRDRETAGLAIHAALTGHIVLSTLHTNNAVGAIPRLIDMKVEPFLLPSTLTMVIAQRLVSRLCDACKKKGEAPPPIQNVIKKALAGLPAGVTGGYKEPYVIYRAPGCAECRDRGTKGRIGLFEVLKMSPALEEIVMREPTASRLSAQAKQEAMVSLRQDGIVKALQGLVSVEEVVRETEDA
ncbi:MAG: type II/IV secretion system protein, partial [Candidatus Liptonbacteria bacterium]|nr:type II/IV secretion system protein [Candidatus Liptonbacteria bacterium]